MGQPNLLLPLALSAFLLLVVVCFLRLGPRRAVLVTLFAGYLFVPHFDGKYTFLVLSSKAAFVPAALVFGSITFDTGRWARFRARPIDIPVALLCLAPYVTAIENDLGAYEGMAAALDATMSWGAPYLLGRLYLGSVRGLSEFATSLVAAALVYAPFCLWEIRMSPQLQFKLYGFRSEAFDTVFRFGGYRPSVFMQAGLALALFMASGTLCAAWLWRTGARREIGGLPLGWVCLGLGATTVLCKSTGAILLLALGLAVLELSSRIRTPLLVLLLAALPAAYCAARMAGWKAETIVALTERSIGGERASSIQFRVENEHQLVQKAMSRPLLGWGRFGRSFVFDESGKMVIADSMWILVFGMGGLVALIAAGAVLAFPALMLLRRYPVRYWNDPRLAPAAVLTVVLLLWGIDDLLNSMMSPLYPAIAGALVSFAVLGGSAWIVPVQQGQAVPASLPRLPRPQERSR